MSTYTAKKCTRYYNNKYPFLSLVLRYFIDHIKVNLNEYCIAYNVYYPCKCA